MTKGFKDSKGKFHPTENDRLSSKDVMHSKEELIEVNKLKKKIDATKVSSLKKGKLISKSELKKTIDTRVDSTVDPAFGSFIANAYENLEDKPNSPEVKKAYDIFIKETLEQARELQKNGLKFEPSDKDNYGNANAMAKDVTENNHIFYRPSDDDFKGIENHPLFKMTNFKNIDGEPMRANDVFRAVHDVNGHVKAMKAQFTPTGEQEAFVEHKKMYSPDAIVALFTETQGQGNWVNFNKETGKQNRKFQDIGDLEKLKFPKQKAGLFPEGIVF